MRRFMALFMATILCISLVGCGSVTCSVEGCKNKIPKDAAETTYCDRHLAKNAYDSIGIAYTYAEWMGDDVIAAWNTGISDKKAFAKKDSSDQVALLASKLHLSYYDTSVGAAAAYQLRWKGIAWETLSEEEKEESRTSDGDFVLHLEAYGNELFQVCVMSVIEGYTHNGYVENAQSSLDLAKGYIKTLSQEYPDYDYSDDLKDYYTAVSSYLEFCMSPTGNFEQASNSNIDYQKQIKECLSGLEFEFGD